MNKQSVEKKTLNIFIFCAAGAFLQLIGYLESFTLKSKSELCPSLIAPQGQGMKWLACFSRVSWFLLVVTY